MGATRCLAPLVSVWLLGNSTVICAQAPPLYLLPFQALWDKNADVYPAHASTS